MTKENAHLRKKQKMCSDLHAKKTQKKSTKTPCVMAKTQLHSSVFPGMVANRNRAGILT